MSDDWRGWRGLRAVLRRPRRAPDHGLVVRAQPKRVLEDLGRLGPAIEAMQHRSLAGEREAPFRDQAGRLAIRLERVLQVARERGHVPAPERRLVLVEEWPAHRGEPTP